MGVMVMIPRSLFLFLLIALATAFMGPRCDEKIRKYGLLLNQNNTPNRSSAATSKRQYQDRSWLEHWWNVQQQQIEAWFLSSSDGSAVVRWPTIIPNFSIKPTRSTIYTANFVDRCGPGKQTYYDKLQHQSKQKLQERRHYIMNNKYHEDRAPGWGTFEFWDGNNQNDKDHHTTVASFLSPSMLSMTQQPLLPTKDNTTRSTAHSYDEAKQNDDQEANTTASSPTKMTSPIRKTASTTTTTSATRQKSVLVIPNKLQKTDVLTVADLEAIFQTNGLLLPMLDSSDAVATKQQQELSNKRSKAVNSSDRVAFPQPSAVSEQAVQYGRTAAASLLGILVGTSVLTNLWLIGGLLGGCYGYMIPVQTSIVIKPDQKNDDDDDSHTNPLATLVTFLGIRIARFVLWWHDAVVSILFLYKTGQLSYQYYKAYSAMDRKWGLQTKIDAWNAKFVQGKQRFDAWERNNEISRKTLAFLRTVWLVEEKQRRRYRIGISKLIQRGWKQMRGDQLILAVASALATGIVWSVLSPPVVMILALGLGAIWPTWLAEWIRLLRDSGRLSTISIRSTASTTTTILNRHRPNSRPSSVVRPVQRKTDVADHGRTLFPFLFRRPASRPSPRVHHNPSTNKNGRTYYYRVGQPVWPWQCRYVEPPPPRWKFWMR